MTSLIGHGDKESQTLVNSVLHRIKGYFYAKNQTLLTVYLQLSTNEQLKMKLSYKVLLL